MKLNPNQEKKCWRCELPLLIKYVHVKKGYSLKNDWSYWTEKTEDKEKYVCQDCLFNLYKNHKWEFQQLVPKKKQLAFRQYVSAGLIKGKLEPCFTLPYYEARPRPAKKKKKKQQNSNQLSGKLLVC